MRKIDFLVTVLLVIALGLGITANVRLNAIQPEKEVKEIAQKETITEIPQDNKNITELTTEERYKEFIYLAFKIPIEGIFIEESGKIQFYEDPNCTIKIEGNPKFSSYHVESIENEDEKDVYCAMMVDGSLAYCKGDQYPDLDRVN